MTSKDLFKVMQMDGILLDETYLTLRELASVLTYYFAFKDHPYPGDEEFTDEEANTIFDQSQFYFNILKQGILTTNDELRILLDNINVLNKTECNEIEKLFNEAHYVLLKNNFFDDENYLDIKENFIIDLFHIYKLRYLFRDISDGILIYGVEAYSKDYEIEENEQYLLLHRVDETEKTLIEMISCDESSLNHRDLIKFIKEL